MQMPQRFGGQGQFHRFIKLIFMSAIIAIIVPLSSRATLPYDRVANNAGRTNSPSLTKSQQSAFQPPDFRRRVYLCWWDMKDQVRYGIPYLVRHEPWTALASCGLLVLLTTIVGGLFRSRRETVPPGAIGSPDAGKDVRGAKSAGGRQN